MAEWFGDNRKKRQKNFRGRILLLKIRWENDILGINHVKKCRKKKRMSKNIRLCACKRPKATHTLSRMSPRCHCKIRCSEETACNREHNIMFLPNAQTSTISHVLVVHVPLRWNEDHVRHCLSQAACVVGVIKTDPPHVTKVFARRREQVDLTTTAVCTGRHTTYTGTLSLDTHSSGGTT